MTTMPADELEPITKRLVDAAYFAWLSLERQCEDALHEWTVGGNRDGDAYALYRATLDREEAAAHDLQYLWERVDPSGRAAQRGATLARSITIN